MHMGKIRRKDKVDFDQGDQGPEETLEVEAKFSEGLSASVHHFAIFQATRRTPALSRRSGGT